MKFKELVNIKKLATIKAIILCSLLLILIFSFHTAKADVSFTVKPSGDVGQRAGNEMRRFAHSDMEPTGLYVEKGDKITVTASGVTKAKIFLGLMGKFDDLNGGNSNVYNELDLPNGTSEFTMSTGIGEVYIENLSETASINVSIEGGKSNPIYRLGETNESDFKTQLENTNAPFFELVGNHFHGLFRTKEDNITALTDRDSVRSLIEYLDDTMVSESKSNGLLFGDKLSLGTNYEYDNKMYLSESDMGGAVTTGRVSLFSHDLILDILKRKSGDDLWGLWHEWGHSFQNPYMLWGTDGNKGDYPSYTNSEVTVNINSLYIQHEEGNKGRIYDNPSARSNIQKYLSLNNVGKDFDTASQGSFQPTTDDSCWIKLGMFNQLMLAYGFNIFSYVNQEYRTMYHSGQAMPQTNEEMRQCFMKVVSEVTQRNLFDYFEKWGLHPNQEVKKEMAQYIKPTVPIENNLLPGEDNAIEDNVLPPIEVPTATPKNVNYTLGALPSDYSLSDIIDLKTTKNMPSGESFSPTAQIFTTNDLLENSSLKLRLTNPQGQSNIIEIPVEKNYGNAISMEAYATEERAIFTLQKKTNTIESFTNEKQETPLDSGSGLYVTFTLIGKDGSIKKKSSCNRESLPQSFVHSLRGVKYEEGDIIEINVAEPGKLQSYVNGVIDVKRSESGQNEYFKIENNQFIHLSASDLAPKATAAEVQVKIGDSLPQAPEFIKNVSGPFGQDNIKAAFSSAPSANEAGEQEGEVTLTDKITGLSTKLKVKANIIYDNSLALAAYDPKDIRAVLRLNESSHTLIGFANPDRKTPIDGNEEKYWDVKIIRGSQVIKDVSAKGTEEPFDFAKSLNGYSYQEGDIIYVFARQKLINNYKNSVLVAGTYDTDNYFKIENNQFEHVSRPAHVYEFTASSFSITQSQVKNLNILEESKANAKDLLNTNNRINIKVISEGGINNKPGDYQVILGLSEAPEVTKKISVTVTPDSRPVTSENIYRLYNKNTGEHFYTNSTFERNNLVKNGWTNEGVGWSAPTTGSAVYRVYNPHAKGGDHYYTASQYEARNLVKNGWAWDNGAKAVFYSGGKAPVYVAFNPNATASGSHNYTKNSYEEQSLLKNGWKFGKVQFYGEK